jgi:hypothetical protein
VAVLEPVLSKGRSTVRRTVRTRPLAALASVLLAASVAALTGCGAGQDAQTIKAYSPADGVIGNSGDIRAVDALVVGAGDSGDGVLSLTLVNRGDGSDRLTGITSPDGSVDLTGSGALAPGKAVYFGADTTPSATISGLKAKPGDTVTLKLTFANTAPMTLRTVVVPATGYYASVTPGPTTPAEETPTDTASPTDTATDTSTDTASPSESSTG